MRYTFGIKIGSLLRLVAFHALALAYLDQLCQHFLVWVILALFLCCRLLWFDLYCHYFLLLLFYLVQLELVADHWKQPLGVAYLHLLDIFNCLILLLLYYRLRNDLFSFGNFWSQVIVSLVGLRSFLACIAWRLFSWFIAILAFTVAPALIWMLPFVLLFLLILLLAFLALLLMVATALPALIGIFLLLPNLLSSRRGRCVWYGMGEGFRWWWCDDFFNFELLWVIEHDFSIIIHREYIDQLVSLPQFVQLPRRPLQTELVRARSLVKHFQLPYQLLDALEVGLHQDPPRHARHLDLQFQQGEIDWSSGDGRPRIEEGRVCAIEIV